MTSTVPQHIVVTAPPKLANAIQETETVCAYLKQKGSEAVGGLLNDENLRKRVHAGEFDLLIAIGGDGTMLRSGHLCAPHNIPVMGINKGHLGFLFQTDEGGWQKMIDQLLAGDFWVEKRMMLRAEHLRSGESLRIWQAINDVVVARGQYLRPIHVGASVDGQHLATYAADGLIAASATGSTAYALAAGGPILPPEVRNILLIPIAPHLSVDRGVVLSEGSIVSITVLSENVVLSVDGQSPTSLGEDDRIDVQAGENTLKFIRFGDPGYFYRNLTARMNQNAALGPA
ncbi:MAG: NAD(+)/NADH kinase [Anaerolineales bacterium]